MPGTSLSWTPPSSLYWTHRSLSRISAAARNLRIAASPAVSLLSSACFLAKRDEPVPNRPPLTVAAPAAKPLLIKERRFASFSKLCSMFFILPLFCRRCPQGVSGIPPVAKYRFWLCRQIVGPFEERELVTPEPRLTSRYSLLL